MGEQMMDGKKTAERSYDVYKYGIACIVYYMYRYHFQQSSWNLNLKDYVVNPSKTIKVRPVYRQIGGTLVTHW